MRLSQPGKPDLRGVAMGSDQAEAVTTLSRKSTDWPDPTRPRSGCSMPISEAHSTTSRTNTSAMPLAQFLEENSSSNGSRRGMLNKRSSMQRSVERHQVESRRPYWQILRCTGWKRLLGSHTTTEANSSENVRS